MTKSHLVFIIFNLEPKNVLVNTKIKVFCTHEETRKSTFDASHPWLTLYIRIGPTIHMPIDVYANKYPP